MRVKVLLFARYRELVGTSELWLELPAGATLRSVEAALLERFPQLDLTGRAMARNQKLAFPEEPLAEGDEVALLPPVSGGEEEALGLTYEPLRAGFWTDWATLPSCGAVVSFLGTTRSPNRGQEVLRLDYEAYPTMAQRVLATIAQEMRQRWELGRIALWHRLGSVAPKEASVLVVVSAPHRTEAFAAARYGIDEIKKRLPVWKKEVKPDGSFWVEGTPLWS
jgi:molybdopterin converting factor subunit 1